MFWIIFAISAVVLWLFCQILQWQAIEKLADDLTIALIPSGEGVILDPTTLLSEGPRHDGHP